MISKKELVYVSQVVDDLQDDGETLALMRLVLGIVFFAHGAQKCWDGSGVTDSARPWDTSRTRDTRAARISGDCASSSAAWADSGFLSRVAAFGIVVNMVVAVLTVHLPFGLFMNWSGATRKERDSNTTSWQSRSESLSR